MKKTYVVLVSLVVIVITGLFFSYYKSPNSECGKITDQNELECSVKMAVKFNDAKYCEVVKNQDKINVCKLAYTASKKDERKCEELSPDYITACKIIVGIESKDDSKCDGLEDLKDTCFYYVNTEQSNFVSDLSMLGKALNNGDDFYCKDIGYEGMRESCIQQLKSRNDSTVS